MTSQAKILIIGATGKVGSKTLEYVTENSNERAIAATRTQAQASEFNNSHK